MTSSHRGEHSSGDRPAKKLIEVALPLESISKESAREKSIRHGHPSTLHSWWARRPLAACRATIFGQLVDDPSSLPEEFPTEEEQDAERRRLFQLMERLVSWDYVDDEDELHKARYEIAKAVARNKDISAPADAPDAVNEFLLQHGPEIHDPFCGGGSIPLEAQRLGLPAIGTDINPVAVLTTRALIDIPARFEGRPPVHAKDDDQTTLADVQWQGATGLAEDVRALGQWLMAKAEERIGDLYPDFEVTPTVVSRRPELKSYEGRTLEVIAWLWARTVPCVNPACKKSFPLLKSQKLSTRKGQEWHLGFSVEDSEYSFSIVEGPVEDDQATMGRGGATCPFCSAKLPFSELRRLSQENQFGERFLGAVLSGDRERVFLSDQCISAPPKPDGDPDWAPLIDLPDAALGFRIQAYGMTRWADLFTGRQLHMLVHLAQLVHEAAEYVGEAAETMGFPSGGKPLCDDGDGARAYGEAVATYLALGVSRVLDRHCNLTTWDYSASKLQVRNAFSRQALSMTWDFAESNPFASTSGGIEDSFEWVAKVLEKLPAAGRGGAYMMDSRDALQGHRRLISTDPPYYDNIGYADLSDFFYVWLRRMLREIHPELFATIVTPKAGELIANPHRHGEDKQAAREFFEEGMRETFQHLRDTQISGCPGALFYAFKQAEQKAGSKSVASTGWETMLEGLVDSGFMITGTWPARTEMPSRQRNILSNALASSVILAYRHRDPDAPIASRKELVDALKRELPEAIKTMQHGNIAPVDLPQASIGPGMAIFSRYSKVLGADGKPVKVREALELINEELDRVLEEEEGELDGDTRAAVTWFSQYGFEPGPYGDIDKITRARGNAPEGMVEAQIAWTGGGKFRLLKRDELPGDWDPIEDTRLTVWEALQHTIRIHRSEGFEAAGALVAKLGGKAEDVRALCYRLYTICDRKKMAEEARVYNELIEDWPRIMEEAYRESSEWQGPLDRFTGE